MKKKIASLAAVIILALSTSTTVFAHGGSHNRHAKNIVIITTDTDLCQIENCNTVGEHWHNQEKYLGHTIGDGHEYHQVCFVTDCTKTINHIHNSIPYLPHSQGDGHSNHQNGNHHK